MTRRKTCRLIATSVYVECPHCAASIPSPGDGSEMWLPEDFKRLLPTVCPDCEAPITIIHQSKVAF